MANHDHTARPCLFCRHNPTCTSAFDEVRFPLRSTQGKQQTYVAKLAGTTLAAEVIHELLDETHHRRDEGMRGKCVACKRRLLTPVQTNGLRAALHFLREYVLVLQPG